jgi:hypothetical protein
LDFLFPICASALGWEEPDISTMHISLFIARLLRLRHIYRYDVS